MGHNKSRTVLVGLSAAAAAFGAAATMSAATAPTAHADDFAAIVSDIEGTLADGQTAFGTAVTDFGSNNVPAGLASFIDGVYDDTVGLPGIAVIGGVEELTNEPFSLNSSFFDFNLLPVPTSFSDAVTEAQSYFADAEGGLNDVSTSLSSGDYGVAASEALGGSVVILAIDPEVLLIGSVEALGF